MSAGRGGRTRRGTVRSAIRVLGFCLLGLPWAATAASDPDALARQLYTVLRAAPLNVSRTAADAPDAELAVAAWTLFHQDKRAAAAAYAEYLRHYYPHSPFTPHTRLDQTDGYFLEQLETDPDFSRYVRQGAALAVGSKDPDPEPEFQCWAELLRLGFDSPAEPLTAEGLGAFLTRHPGSAWSGWAAYQEAWQPVFGPHPEQASAALRRFAREHADHPLGAEAAQAAAIPWFDPAVLARISAVMPVWGQMRLEPEAPETGSAWLSELTVIAGLASFAVLAQQGEPEYLTGVLVAANLLGISHFSGAERSYQLAIRRNAAQRIAFLNRRLDQTLSGAGTFTPAEPAPTGEPGIFGLGAALGYRIQGIASSVRGTGWVREDQLPGLAYEVFGWWRWLDSGRLAAWFEPYAHVASSLAQSRTEAPFTAALVSRETLAGVRAVVGLDLDLSGMRLRPEIAAGAAYRLRHLEAGAEAYGDQGAVLVGAASLSLTGPSGGFFRVSLAADRAPAAYTWSAFGRTLPIEPLGLEFRSSLGVAW